MAAQAGLELTRFSGSGPHGRIVKSDIEAALAGGARAGRAAAAAAEPRRPPRRRAPPQPQPPARPGCPPSPRCRIRRMRKVIARRLTESKRDQPHFYLTVDCEIDALLKLRAELNAKSPEGKGSYKLSVNDLVIKAAAVALKRVPAANASWTDERDPCSTSRSTSRWRSRSPNGLITPIVRNADDKGLAQISDEMKDLAERRAPAS